MMGDLVAVAVEEDEPLGRCLLEAVVAVVLGRSPTGDADLSWGWDDVAVLGAQSSSIVSVSIVAVGNLVVVVVAAHGDGEETAA